MAVSSLIKSTGSVSAMTLLSRVLGFVRDVAFATLFGAGPGMDAFLVAFKIPNFFRRLFGEGALRQSFVPVLSAVREAETEDAVSDLINAVAGTLAVILVGITLVGVIAAPVFIYVFAPGFSDNASQFDLAVGLLRLTFPYLLFIALTALAGGVLNSYGRFAVPAFTPVVLNICLISAALVAAPYFARPETALALAVLVAGLLQLALQVPFLIRLGHPPRPRWAWRDSAVRRVLRLMVPILFGSSVTQINMLLGTIIASMLATGSVSWLYYADRLMEFPLGVFSIAIATVILPGLSARHASASRAEFAATMDWALKLLTLIGLPAMTGLFVLAGPLVATLFGYHSFSTHDTRMSAYALMAYAFGFMGFSLVKVLVTGFFSREDSRTPVRCGVIAMTATMAMNIAFVGVFLWRGWSAPHVGLALATSLGAFINAGLLFYYLRRANVLQSAHDWPRLLFQVTVGCVLMAAVIVLGSAGWTVWLERTVEQRVLWLAAWLVIGAVVYFAGVFAAGFRLRHLHFSETG